MTNNKNRFFSWIVLLIFSFVILSSTLFIIVHTNHDCIGEECTICAELAECHKNLHTTGKVGSTAICLTSLLLIAFVLTQLSIKPHHDHTTLISLKVELLI